MREEHHKHRIGFGLLLVAALLLGTSRLRAAETVVPETDPEPERPVQLIEAVRDQHPRLLFTAEELAELRKRATPENPHFSRLLKYLPASNPPKGDAHVRNDTDAQRQGFWRMPTVALHYALTGEQRSFDRTVGFLENFLAADSWQEGAEPDSGMGAANLMVGAALAYDWLYHDLDPEFREKVRNRLLLQARRMYYGGHLMRSPGTHYWQQDPQNNHRWHRLAGLALAVLAVADSEDPADDWMLEQTLAEIEFVVAGLAPDGSHHEGPSYNVFGMPHLVLAIDAADRCLGTDLLTTPYFANNVRFRLHTLVPGFQESFHFGDSAGLGHISDYLWRLTAANGLENEQALVNRYAETSPKAFQYGWFGMIWHDPALDGGDPGEVDTKVYFDDLGLVCIREGWEEDAVALLFKCGPYGGHLMHDRRRETGSYVNVAHDDPDAGSFQIAVGGDRLIVGDGYAKTKRTAPHATILVNGEGQLGEGKGWTQPLPRNAEAPRIVSVKWQPDGGAIIEADVAPAYEDLPVFHRTVRWAPGEAISVEDTIETGPNDTVTWLLPAPAVSIDSNGHTIAATLSDGEASATLPVRISTNQGTAATVTDSPAEHRGKAMGYEQLRLEVQGPALEVVARFMPWPRQDE